MAKKTIKETLAPFLTKIGLEDEKVAALFNADGTELTDNAEAELTAYDAARIKKLQTSSKTEAFNQGHQKGLAEGASKWEKEALEEFEITSDKKGVELIREIIEKKSTVKPELEEDKVKTHPVFVKMKRELEKAVTETETKWKTQFETREQEILRKETFNNVVGKAKNFVTTLKPILPKEQAKAEKQMQFLVNELNGYEYKEVDGQILVMKDGKPLEDNHGKTIEFNSLVKGIAESIWDFQEGQQRSGSGNSNDGNGQQRQTVKAPATEAEYIQRMKSAKSAEERIQIDDAWKSKAEGVDA